MLTFLVILLILGLIGTSVFFAGLVIAFEYLLIKARGYGAEAEELWEALDRALRYS